MTKDQLKGKPTRSGYPGGEGNKAGSFTKRHFIDKAPFAKLKTKTPIKVKPIPKIKPARIGSRVKDARKAWRKNPKIRGFHSQAEWDAMTPAGRQAAVKKIAGLKQRKGRKPAFKVPKIPGGAGTAAGFLEGSKRKAVPIPGAKSTRRKAVPIPGAKGERRKASPIAGGAGGTTGGKSGGMLTDIIKTPYDG
jgi:hypothetical protein